MTFFGFLVNSDFIFTVYDTLKNERNLSQRVSFSEVIVNKGGAWKPGLSAFIVPVDGMYFFNFHSTSLDGLKLTMSMKTIMSNLMDSSVVEDSLSRSALLALKKNDAITFYSNADASKRKSQYGMTSFKGFLYSPSTETPKSAWSVHCLSGMQKEYILPSLYENVKNKINFGNVLTNIGNIYNVTTREALIKERSIYYVSCAVSGVYGDVTVSLVLNDKSISIIRRPVVYRNIKKETYVTRESAVLLDLQKNDKLAVKYFIMATFFREKFIPHVALQGL